MRKKQHKHFYSTTIEGNWMVWKCRDCKDILIMLKTTFWAMSQYGIYNPLQIVREHNLGMLATGRKQDPWLVRKWRDRRRMKSWSTSDGLYLSNRPANTESKESASAISPK